MDNELESKEEFEQVPRDVSECLRVMNSSPDGTKLLLDSEVVELVEKKHMAGHQLEKAVGDPSRGVRIRRKIYGKHGNLKRAMENLPYQHYDYQKVLGACCENVVGYMPVPVGVVGPLNLDGRSLHIPMATTEGCLVASTNRGCRALQGCGVSTAVTYDGYYIDPANQLKGGKLDIKIDNLKKYFPKAKSEQVDLSINFNGGDNAKDGLFTMSVDYELNHVNKEQGTLNVERTSDGKTWTTKVSVKSKNNAAVKIITPFDMTLQSDRKTFMDGVVKCSQGETYTIKVNRVPGKKMDVIVEGMGKTYIVNGVRDGKKKITIDIDAAGIKQTVELNNNSNGDKIAFNGDFNLGPYGSFNIVLDVNRDGKSGKMDVRMGSAVVFSAVLKGKVDATKKSAKYEVRHALASREGKVRLSLVGQPNMEFSFQYLPKGSTDLKIKITRSKVGNVIQWSGLASRGGEEYLNYKNKIEYKEISDAFTLDVNSKFHVNDKSVLHPMFCTYGCFNDRSANMKVLVKKNTPYKLSVDIELFKDAQSVLTLDINTINNPSVEFTADHKPGSYLKVTSNTRSQVFLCRQGG